jgi:hypothetical protein
VAGREAGKSPPFSAEVKNGGAISPLPHLSSWHSACLIKHRNNFAFTLTYLNMSLFGFWNNKLFGREVLTGFVILQYSITIYADLMIALCDRNTSLNLRESMDSVVI